MRQLRNADGRTAQETNLVYYTQIRGKMWDEALLEEHALFEAEAEAEKDRRNELPPLEEIFKYVTGSI